MHSEEEQLEFQLAETQAEMEHMEGTLQGLMQDIEEQPLSADEIEHING